MASEISPQDAQYAIEMVKEICTEVGPGLPGSPQEWERAARFKNELETHLGAGNVTLEEFPVAPGAFLGSLAVGAILMLAAALLNTSLGRLAGIPPWAMAIAALGLSILSIGVVIAEFICYFELVDPFFRKKRSVNVIGRLRRPGTETVKRLLIVSGHHDSALENIWLRWLGKGFYAATLIWLAGLVSVLVMSILQLAGVITSSASLGQSGPLGWVLLVFPVLPSVIFGISPIFPTQAGKNGGTVPGAVDNLSAGGVAVAMCRFLVENPGFIPADTEIRFITFGSEEAGLRGSRRYVERHLDELRRLDVRVLNYEMIANAKISILTNDVSGTVKNSPEMVRSLIAAAERAGVPYQVKPYPFGGGASDAGSFSQAGFKAATLFPFKMPEQMIAFYHQREDTPDKLSIEPLFNVLKLTLEWIRCGGEA